MSIPFNMKRDELLAKLEALRPAAEQRDAEAQKQHKLDEKAYLVKFREALREALKWTYEEGKAQYFNVTVYSGKVSRYGRKEELDRPTCPVSEVRRLDRLIGMVNASTQQRFVINHGGKYNDLHKALTAGIATDAGDMCDA